MPCILKLVISKAPLNLMQSYGGHHTIAYWAGSGSLGQSQQLRISSAVAHQKCTLILVAGRDGRMKNSGGTIRRVALHCMCGKSAGAWTAACLYSRYIHERYLSGRLPGEVADTRIISKR